MSIEGKLRAHFDVLTTATARASDCGSTRPDFNLEEPELEAELLDIMMGEKYFSYLGRRNFVAQPVPRYTAVESRIIQS